MGVFVGDKYIWMSERSCSVSMFSGLWFRPGLTFLQVFFSMGGLRIGSTGFLLNTFMEALLNLGVCWFYFVYFF